MLSMGIDISLGDTILRVSNCVPKVQLFSRFLDLDQHLVDWPLHSKKKTISSSYYRPPHFAFPLSAVPPGFVAVTAMYRQCS